MPEELDTWLRSQPLHDPQHVDVKPSEPSPSLARLEQENAALRQQLSKLAAELGHAAQDTPFTYDRLSDECSRLLQASKDARLGCAASAEIARKVRAVRSLQNHSVGNRPLFDAQISVMLTCCAIADDDLMYGRIHEARQLVQRLRRVCESIQVRLSQVQLPDDQTSLTQEQLMKLQSRILTIESRFAA
jgi:hypothetical protein